MENNIKDNQIISETNTTFKPDVNKIKKTVLSITIGGIILIILTALIGFLLISSIKSSKTSSSNTTNTTVSPTVSVTISPTSSINEEINSIDSQLNTIDTTQKDIYDSLNQAIPDIDF